MLATFWDEVVVDSSLNCFKGESMKVPKVSPATFKTSCTTLKMLGAILSHGYVATAFFPPCTYVRSALLVSF